MERQGEPGQGDERTVRMPYVELYFHIQRASRNSILQLAVAFFPCFYHSFGDCRMPAADWKQPDTIYIIFAAVFSVETNFSTAATFSPVEYLFNFCWFVTLH